MQRFTNNKVENWIFYLCILNIVIFSLVAISRWFSQKQNFSDSIPELVTSRFGQ